jgi:hypothetical protein
VCWWVPFIPAIQGSTNRRIIIQVSLGIKQDPTSKIANMKRAGKVAQEVEQLSSKCKALTSILSIAKTKPINKQTKTPLKSGRCIGGSEEHFHACC